MLFHSCTVCKLFFLLSHPARLFITLKTSYGSPQLPDLWITSLLFELNYLFSYYQFDWLRAEVFQLNLKYLHVKITNILRVVVDK